MSSRITASYCPTYDADTTFCPVSSLIRRSIATNLQLSSLPHLWNLARFSMQPSFSSLHFLSTRNDSAFEILPFFWTLALSLLLLFSLPHTSVCFASHSRNFFSSWFSRFSLLVCFPKFLLSSLPHIFLHAPFRQMARSPPKLIVLHSVMRKLCTLLQEVQNNFLLFYCD